jgi:hypothetical protein
VAEGSESGGLFARSESAGAPARDRGGWGAVRSLGIGLLIIVGIPLKSNSWNQLTIGAYLGSDHNGTEFEINGQFPDTGMMTLAILTVENRRLHSLTPSNRRKMIVLMIVLKEGEQTVNANVEGSFYPCFIREPYPGGYESSHTPLSKLLDSIGAR